MWRLPRGENDVKRDREDELGLALWSERDAFWAAQQPPGMAKRVVLSATEPRGRVLFAAREAIVASAERAGREAWFGRGGEMSCLGLLPGQRVDRFELEPQLVMRAPLRTSTPTQRSSYGPRRACAVRGHSPTRISQAIAVGERAVRINGDGPRAGVIEEVDAIRLQLRLGSDSVEVDPESYALVAGSRLVASWRGSEVLRDIQIASGGG